VSRYPPALAGADPPGPRPAVQTPHSPGLCGRDRRCDPYRCPNHEFTPRAPPTVDLHQRRALASRRRRYPPPPPSIDSRYGARYFAAILAGGDQLGASLISESEPCPPVRRALRYSSSPAPSRIARISGERLRLDRRAGQRRDRLGSAVGLLGGDAAVLDREIGGMAGGEHVLERADPAVRVDRNEPAARTAGHPGRRRPEQLGQRDHAVHLERPVAGMDRDVPGRGHRAVRRGDRRDAVLGEPIPSRSAS
jgi:hypothetical protein